MDDEIKEQLTVAVRNVLLLKDDLKRIEDNLEISKLRLLDLMKTNKKNAFRCEEGKATIMRFDRDSLKKEETLETLKKFNDGEINGVDIEELLKVSKVEFVLVKGVE